MGKLDEPFCICCDAPLVEHPIPDIHMCKNCRAETALKVAAKVKAHKTSPGVRKTYTIKFK